MAIRQRDMLNLLTRVRAKLENRPVIELREEIATEQGLPTMFTNEYEKAEEVLKVADKVLERVSASEILAFFAVKNADLRPDGGDTDGGDKAKKDMEKKKGWYLEAMAKKGLALCVLDRLEEANKCLLYLLQFVDQSDSKAVFFATVHAERVGHYGRALKLIQHQLEEKPGSSDLDNRQSHLYDKLGWDHAAKMARMSKPLRFPTAYDMF